MDAALRFLGARARTVREVERHLDACEYGEIEISETVERLIELNLLNDAAFAEDFIQTRLATKPVSRARLREQLRMHEVEEDAAERALQALPDDTETDSAGKIAEKYARQYQGLTKEKRDEMILRRLLSRGYSYEDARAAVVEATREYDE